MPRKLEGFFYVIANVFITHKNANPETFLNEYIDPTNSVKFIIELITLYTINQSAAIPERLSSTNQSSGMQVKPVNVSFLKVYFCKTCSKNMF